MATSAKKLVTFEGATPAGGGEDVSELQVEDGHGNRVLLRKGIPTECSAALAAAAQKVDHHKVTVGKPDEEPQSGEGESSG